MLNYQQIGMAYLEPLANSMYINQMFDSWMWVMLKMAYAPYSLPDQFNDVDKWVSSVNLNGARWGSVCKPD